MKYLDIIRNTSILNVSQIIFKILPQYSTKIDLEKLESESATSVDVLDEEAKKKEANLELKRNKSRLNLQHRNILLNQKPYNESIFWTHDTVKYARKVYGKYGENSRIDPSFCWPTKQELQDTLEYQRVAYPFTVLEMMEKAQIRKKEENERLLNKQKEITDKMAKLDQWKKDLHDKIKKKEAEELAARVQKERLIEEVRRHFGYAVDPRDEKFKEMVEKKEKEQKKLMKEARRKVKEEKMLAKLLSKKSEEKTETNNEEKQLN
ncbi:growth arrest and DNA damage-inducible proteins-interacting protein 1 [Agrilus planipennis]|uniref:Large ribosomal subunit protein mL64 n=1 Tax=Agrilus planipennis TaxID=224129 RepID=A0A7F5R2Q9_AGRPL|nr:growth arrest and DNA damage-inducible proteins-interacting protein 1 [Agrilus planipennis]